MIEPFLEDTDFKLYCGDVREVLTELPDESVHCAVTSPPYYALRDYGTASWEGGSEDCDHQPDKTRSESSILKGTGTGDAQFGTLAYKDFCKKCGAKRIDKQIGLEQTPEAYVDELVKAFAQLRRVLRKDGSFWINIGDSYAGAGYSNHENTGGAQREDGGKQSHTTGTGLKNKDLIGIPWLLAFALRKDGWYLRSEVIWSKIQCMPESITDRPSKSHEQIFLLTRSPRYYYDMDAVREPLADSTLAGGRSQRVSYDGVRQGENGTGQEAFSAYNEQGRNKRTVWELTMDSYREAHFATYPKGLVRPCIQAGTSEFGVCPDCGDPWRRVVESRSLSPWSDRVAAGAVGGMDAVMTNGRSAQLGVGVSSNLGSERKTIGWKPTCNHYESFYRALPRTRNANRRLAQDVTGLWWERAQKRPGESSWPRKPAVVMDPFMGSGTTAFVARELGRAAVGIDLNPEYCALAMKRTQQLSLFAEAV